METKILQRKNYLESFKEFLIKSCYLVFEIPCIYFYFGIDSGTTQNLN